MPGMFGDFDSGAESPKGPTMKMVNVRFDKSGTYGLGPGHGVRVKKGEIVPCQEDYAERHRGYVEIVSDEMVAALEEDEAEANREADAAAEKEAKKKARAEAAEAKKAAAKDKLEAEAAALAAEEAEIEAELEAEAAAAASPDEPEVTPETEGEEPQE